VFRGVLPVVRQNAVVGDSPLYEETLTDLNGRFAAGAAGREPEVFPDKTYQPVGKNTLVALLVGADGDVHEALLSITDGEGEDRAIGVAAMAGGGVSVHGSRGGHL